MASPPRASAQDRFKDPRAAALAELIEPTVTAHGLYLEELALTAKGAATILQVTVDYETGTENVDLDTLAGLSEALSVVLDHAEEEQKAGAAENSAAKPLVDLDSYELEVTTPGATRPLTEPRHFSRNLGRLLEIEAEGQAAVNARLQDVAQDGIVVQEIKPPPKKGMKPKTGPQRHIPFGSITRARVQVEFS